MKIKVNIEQNGLDILKAFCDEAKKSNIDVDVTKVKFFVKNKDNKDVEISPERFSIVYSQE